MSNILTFSATGSGLPLDGRLVSPNGKFTLFFGKQDRILRLLYTSGGEYWKFGDSAIKAKELWFSLANGNGVGLLGGSSNQIFATIDGEIPGSLQLSDDGTLTVWGASSNAIRWSLGPPRFIGNVPRPIIAGEQHPRP
jgi:hypothetical protein